MTEYNGHRSWNAWNVSLWISNDEPLYRFAMSCIDAARKNPRCRNILTGATRRFMHVHGGSKTPDGARFTALSVRLCIESFLED